MQSQIDQGPLPEDHRIAVDGDTVTGGIGHRAHHYGLTVYLHTPLANPFIGRSPGR